jgi:hypothetical protein
MKEADAQRSQRQQSAGGDDLSGKRIPARDAVSQSVVGEHAGHEHHHELQLEIEPGCNVVPGGFQPIQHGAIPQVAVLF